MFRKSVIYSVFFILLFGTVACTFFGGDDESVSSTGNGSTAVSRKDHEGRGSEVCQDWQYNYCNYVMARCDFGLAGTMEECLKDHSAIICSSEKVAEHCAEALTNATKCGVPEDQCIYLSMADQEAAEALCEDLAEALCVHEVETCDGDTTVDKCTKKRIAQLQCEKVYGVFLDLDVYLADLAALGSACEDVDTDTSEADGGVSDTETADPEEDTGPCEYSDCKGQACDKRCCLESACREDFFDEDDIEELFLIPDL